MIAVWGLCRPWEPIMIQEPGVTPTSRERYDEQCARMSKHRRRAGIGIAAALIFGICFWAGIVAVIAHFAYKYW